MDRGGRDKERDELKDERGRSWKEVNRIAGKSKRQRMERNR